MALGGLRTDGGFRMRRYSQSKEAERTGGGGKCPPLTRDRLLYGIRPDVCDIHYHADG